MSVIDFAAEKQKREPDEPAFIGADYVEFQPDTFRGYFVEWKGQKSIPLPSLHLAEMQARAVSNNVMYLSSVDNFHADSRKR